MDEEGLKRLILETAEETRRHVDTAFGETRRHVDVVAEDLKSRIEVVAEGVLANTERIERLDGRIDQLDGRIDHLEHEMHHEFEELRSMIRLSYTELDRRLRTLEETVAHLQSRMDRLESSSPQ